MVQRKLSTVMWVSVACVLLLTNGIVAFVGRPSGSVLSDGGSTMNVSESFKRFGLKIKGNLSENSTSPAYNRRNDVNERIESRSAQLAPENIQNFNENYNHQEQFNLEGHVGDYSAPIQNHNGFRINVPSFSETRASKLEGQFSSGGNVQNDFVINVPHVNKNFGVQLRTGYSLPDDYKLYGKHLPSQHLESGNYSPIYSGFVENPSSYETQQDKNSYNYNNAIQNQGEGYLHQHQDPIIENNQNKQTYEDKLQQELGYLYQGNSENVFQPQGENYKKNQQKQTCGNRIQQEHNYANQGNSENVFQHQDQNFKGSQQKHTYNHLEGYNHAYQSNSENFFQHQGKKYKDNQQKQRFDKEQQKEYKYAYQGNSENVFQHQDQNFKANQQKITYDNLEDNTHAYQGNSENVFQHQDKNANQQKQTYGNLQDDNHAYRSNSEYVFQHQDQNYKDNQQKQTYNSQQEQENNFAYQESLKNVYDNQKEQSINSIEKLRESYWDLNTRPFQPSPMLDSGVDSGWRAIQGVSHIYFEQNQPNIKKIDAFAESQPRLTNDRYQYPPENQNMFSQNQEEHFDQYQYRKNKSQISTSDEILHDHQDMETDKRDTPLNKFEMDKLPYAMQVPLDKPLPPYNIGVPNPSTYLEERVPYNIKKFVHQPNLPVRLQLWRGPPHFMDKQVPHPVNVHVDAYQHRPFTREKKLMYVVKVPVVKSHSSLGRKPYKVLSSVEQPLPSSVPTRFDQYKNIAGVINPYSSGYGNSLNWNIQNYPLKMSQVNYNNQWINKHHNIKDFDQKPPPVTIFSNPWDKTQPGESFGVLKHTTPYTNNAGSSDLWGSSNSPIAWGMQFQNIQNFPLEMPELNNYNEPRITRHQNSKDFDLTPPVTSFSNSLGAIPSEKYYEYLNPKSTYNYDTPLSPTFYNSQEIPSSTSRQSTITPSEVQQILEDLGLKTTIKNMNNPSNIQTQ